MRSPLLTKLSILFGRRLSVNWLLLCLVSVFVLIALLESSHTNTSDSVASSAQPDIYTSYRKLKTQVRSDYLELKEPLSRCQLDKRHWFLWQGKRELCTLL